MKDRSLKLMMRDAMFGCRLKMHKMVGMWASYVGMMDMGNWAMYVW